MPILNVACPICTETFDNADDIYSTSCGHIFHFVCMRDWQSRSTSCPQCRFYSPTTHKMYLSFDDQCDENLKEINDLKIKLQCSTEEIQKLHDQIEERDVNFLHLQEHYTASEELIRELKEQNLQSSDSKTNFLSLQRQYTLTEDLNKKLQESVQLLGYEIECKAKELQLKTMQVAALKASLEAVESQACETILNERIKMLEQKLKHLSSEFEKEITNSTQLSIDKMKLQSYIDRMNSEANNNDSGINSNSSILSQEEAKSPNQPTISNSNETNEQKLLANTSHSKENEFIVSQNVDSGTITSVFINGYVLNQITYPLENAIIALAAKMDLTICKDDLIKVYIMENNRYRMHAQCVILFVQFKSLDLKIKFLSNKNSLRNHSTTAFLTIKEYVDDFTFSLFGYAKQNLLANGFPHIFCINNQVIAKKNCRDRKGIRIFSRYQVDDLLKRSHNSSYIVVRL